MRMYFNHVTKRWSHEQISTFVKSLFSIIKLKFSALSQVAHYLTLFTIAYLLIVDNDLVLRLYSPTKYSQRSFSKQGQVCNSGSVCLSSFMGWMVTGLAAVFQSETAFPGYGILTFR